MFCTPKSCVMDCLQFSEMTPLETQSLVSLQDQVRVVAELRD